ncbi:hypothetical protein KP509_35G002100 [Ceratopteris richardii]|uniref:Leucine-rich repeat-containing N-terminal plant-type domain-containing protein n=1 Tax=Ceratopteris richardii TaxID=49495 RepID=A0A8T2QE00_CERRI|nr:hypothetical protein KP509_35G002100 [Ceratopteris richardii]
MNWTAVSALMVFKRGISRDIHNILGSWDPSLATPLGWFHVTCDAAGRVIRLDLYRNVFSGPIRLGLDNFIRGKLKRLEVNSLTGPISWNLGFVPSMCCNLSTCGCLGSIHCSICFTSERRW